MTLYRGYDRIDFRTEIDWDSRNRRLRVALPTGLARDEAVYSIPYGALRRSSYEPEMGVELATNGDWPAVNWVDVYDEDRDYGVAVLNVGTPSHKVVGGLVLLSLLRSPAELWSVTAEDYDYCLDFDGVRDAGSHVFRYSLVPHRGDFRAAGIERRGRELNNPLICRPLRGNGTGGMGPAHSFLRLDATGNILMSALKKADRDDAIMVRLAETAGEPGRASLAVHGTEGSVSLVNFLERQARPASGVIPLAPFQILTIRLTPGAAGLAPRP
jgi:alpha-mannosidase